MTEKLVPIKNFSEKDARFLRKLFLEVANDESLSGTATGRKVQVEAGKNLARLQHLLQVDKGVEKASLEENKKQQELTDADKDVIKEALGFK